jgi:threonine aldolase
MFKAAVGDDIYGECPTTNKFQEKMAEVTGKEAALFCPSGTMTNLIALMIMAPHRGDSIIVGDKSHIVNYEHGNATNFGGVNLKVLENCEYTAMLETDDINKLLPNIDDPHISKITGMSIESCH